MIDYNRKIVFIHIPRTGGTSIEEAFRLTEESKPIHHFTASENKNLLLSQGEDPAKYCWFTFIRNPYDKVISSYFQKTNRKIGQQGGYTLYQFLKKWSGISGKSEHSRTQLGYIDLPDISIFRFENRNHEIKKLSKMFNVSFDDIHKRKSNRNADYRVYYDKTTKELVYNMFRDDIEAFGYEY